MTRKTTAILMFIIWMFVVLLFLSSVYDWYSSIYVQILLIVVLIVALRFSMQVIGEVILTELDYFSIIALLRRSKELLNEIADRKDLDDSLRCGARNAYSNLTAKMHWLESKRHRHYESIKWMRRYLNYLPEELAIKVIKLISSTRISKIISIFLILALLWISFITYIASNGIEYPYVIVALLATAFFVLIRFSDELVDYPIELVLARRSRNIIDEIIDSDSIDNDIKSEARSVCNDKSGLSLYDSYIEWMKLNMDKLPAELSIKMKKEIWLIRLAKKLTLLILTILVFGFMVFG